MPDVEVTAPTVEEAPPLVVFPLTFPVVLLTSFDLLLVLCERLRVLDEVVTFLNYLRLIQ